MWRAERLSEVHNFRGVNKLGGGGASTANLPLNVVIEQKKSYFIWQI